MRYSLRTLFILMTLFVIGATSTRYYRYFHPDTTTIQPPAIFVNIAKDDIPAERFWYTFKNNNGDTKNSLYYPIDNETARIMSKYNVYVKSPFLALSSEIDLNKTPDGSVKIEYLDGCTWKIRVDEKNVITGGPFIYF